MVDITLTGPGRLSDWDSVVGKARDSGIDPNSLYVGTDGLVYGKTQSFIGTDGVTYAGGTWSILGNWAGDPSYKTGSPPGSPAGAAPGSSSSGGGYGPGGIVGGWPWWVFVLVIVGAVVLIREA